MWLFYAIPLTSIYVAQYNASISIHPHIRKISYFIFPNSCKVFSCVDVPGSFTLSSASKNLSCFQFLAIMNRTVMNFEVKEFSTLCFGTHRLFFYEWLCWVVWELHFYFLRIVHIVFPKSLDLSKFPPAMNENPSIPASTATLIVLILCYMPYAINTTVRSNLITESDINLKESPLPFFLWTCF